MPPWDEVTLQVMGETALSAGRNFNVCNISGVLRIIVFWGGKGGKIIIIIISRLLVPAHPALLLQ